MKIVRWLTGWGSLYILAAIFIAALYWVQNLNIKPVDDEILSIGMLVGFGFILSSWIHHHESNFLDSEIEQFRVEEINSDCHQAWIDQSERLN